MNEPRPAMISARPPDSRSRVAKSWKTRTGSSELSTVTALERRMLRVTRRRGAQDDGGGRDRIVGPVMLADAEDVEAHLVGELDLLHQVAEPLPGAARSARGWVGVYLREAVDPEFHATGNALPCGLFRQGGASVRSDGEEVGIVGNLPEV